MGRFASAVEFYGSREPYAASFFSAVAERVGLGGQERLIDLGCGPAQLAIGFAPYVAEVTGVDIEPAMLELAARNAASAGVALTLVESKVEELPASVGRFELATIGRALHWMDRVKTLAVLERIVVPGGQVAICGATADVTENAWVAAYKEVRQRWSSEPDEKRYKIDYDAWAAGSRFRKIDEVRVPSRRRVSVEEIVRRALSMSTTSPAVVGERRAEFEDGVRRAVRPFATEGVLEENIVSVGTLFEDS